MEFHERKLLMLHFRVKFRVRILISNNGAPGGGSSVKLRGVTSIYGNTQPLYVLDGVFINNAAVPAGLNTVTRQAREAIHQTRIILQTVLRIYVQKTLQVSKF